MSKAKWYLALMWGYLGLVGLFLVGGFLGQEPVWTFLTVCVWTIALISLVRVPRDPDDLEAFVVVQVIALVGGLILALPGTLPYPLMLVGLVLWVAAAGILVWDLIEESYLGSVFLITQSLFCLAYAGIGPTVHFTLYHSNSWLPWLLVFEAAVIVLTPTLMALEDAFRAAKFARLSGAE